jgi:hypothetical protein
VRETEVALAGGGTAWLVGIVAYAASLMAKERLDALLALLYNAPVAFLFLVLLTHMGVRAAHLGFTRFVRVFGGTLALWAVGAVILYLRLVAKTIEVSGHMVWLPLLTVQTWLQGFPSWVVILGVLSTVGALYLKLAVFQGPSGVPGLVAGALLAGTLLLCTRLWGATMP